MWFTSGTLVTLLSLGLLIIGSHFQPEKLPELPKANTQDAGDQTHMWHQRWLAMKHKARLRGEKPKVKWMRFVETFYAQSGKTASGKPTVQGVTVAVDPNVIPLGSKVQVKYGNGKVKTYTAEDTGGLVKGRHIDVYDSSVSECLDKGRQEVEVRIIK